MNKIDPNELQQMFEANKDGWNKRTAVHKNAAFYDVESFKAGTSSLNKTELEEVGDVRGKTMLHLQCHFGLDTLSWAREGAIVTGVDLSDVAIDTANQLKDELGIDATFICANVYDLPNVLNQQYDIVFTSYGVIGWLPDMQKWAQVIAHFLKPGGTFYMVEFHPVVWMMDEKFSSIKYHYHNVETIAETSSGTYTDRNADIHYNEYSWNHSLSEVINALLQNGLTLTGFNEFPYSHYNCFQNVIQGDDGLWRVKGLENKIPMMYAVKAIKR
jgi:ubiquinone/menaquinone biosynthesis C-methylase UbiE